MLRSELSEVCEALGTVAAAHYTLITFQEHGKVLESKHPACPVFIPISSDSTHLLPALSNDSHQTNS